MISSDIPAVTFQGVIPEQIIFKSFFLPLIFMFERPFSGFSVSKPYATGRYYSDSSIHCSSGEIERSGMTF